MHICKRTERRRHDGDTPFQRCWLRNSVADSYFFKAGPNLLEKLDALGHVDIPDGDDPRQTFRKLGLVLPVQVPSGTSPW